MILRAGATHFCRGDAFTRVVRERTMNMPRAAKNIGFILNRYFRQCKRSVQQTSDEKKKGGAKRRKDE